MVVERILPRYPIYIPSKGRHDRCLTADFLIEDDVPFCLVVEPQERDAYAAVFGEDRILVLPFSNKGSVIPARNWIKDHATAGGYLRHWQFDDNIKSIYRRHYGKRLYCQSNIAIAAVEDFVDRYENVAVAGFNYVSFLAPENKKPPFHLNNHVYSSSLILNELPHRWRGRYNEDTDFCLQVLADGWCTILVNAFLIGKTTTMMMKGGNTDDLYQGDGRLKMARSLERLWPGVVKTGRRFQRPQHIVYDSWKRFDTPLVRKKDVDIDLDKYAMELVQVKPEIKSKELKRYFQEASKKK